MKELKKFADQLIAEGHWNVSCDCEIVEEAGAQARVIKHISFSYPKIETDIVTGVEDEVDTGEDELADVTEGEELCTPEEMVAYIKKAMDQFGGAGPDGANVKIVEDPDSGDLVITCHKIILGDEESPKKEKCCGDKCCCNKNKEADDVMKSFVEGMEAALRSTSRQKRDAWDALRRSMFE